MAGGARTYTADSTPRCVIDLPKAERNAREMLERVTVNLGLSFRPHCKTHKTVEGALLQTGGKKSKIIVSTIPELKFYADHGFDDILYAVPLVGTWRMEFVAALLEGGRDVKVAMDHPEQLEQLEQWAAGRSGTPKFPVVLMLACDPSQLAGEAAAPGGNAHKMHQVGPDPTADSTFAFAAKIAKSEATTFLGCYIHEAHSYSCKTPSDIHRVARQACLSASNFAKELQQKHGISSSHVSIGSTPVATVIGAGSDPDPSIFEGLTEIHAGNYLCYDSMQADIGCIAAQPSALEERVALFLECRVISKYESRNRLLIDMGWTGASAQGAESGYGRIVNFPELAIKTLKQETGEVGPREGDEPLDFGKYPVGTVLRFVPYHACAACHQYTSVFVRGKDGQICDEWACAPRR
eukprot:Hpha_TRINITY_DN31067_c0_g1::TRINITY_DN31067_c0_g1_i1::g.63953::m.63953